MARVSCVGPDKVVHLYKNTMDDGLYDGKIHTICGKAWLSGYYYGRGSAYCYECVSLFNGDKSIA